MNKKLKSYPVAIAFFALIGLFVNDTGILAPEKYSQYVDALLALLIAAGIISSPGHGKGYGDK